MKAAGHKGSPALCLVSRVCSGSCVCVVCVVVRELMWKGWNGKGWKGLSYLIDVPAMWMLPATWMWVWMMSTSKMPMMRSS